MKAVVRIELKPGVLDPQGQAIARALNALGFDEVAAARQGKVIELDIAAEDEATARSRVEAMCAKLLANPVIERYAIDILSEAAAE